jgi:hypothetical protein
MQALCVNRNAVMEQTAFLVVVDLSSRFAILRVGCRRSAPPGSKHGTRYGAPRAENRGTQGGRRAFQNVQREAGGHAAVLDADF